MQVFLARSDCTTPRRRGQPVPFFAFPPPRSPRFSFGTGPQTAAALSTGSATTPSSTNPLLGVPAVAALPAPPALLPPRPPRTDRKPSCAGVRPSGWAERPIAARCRAAWAAAASAYLGLPLIGDAGGSPCGVGGLPPPWSVAAFKVPMFKGDGGGFFRRRAVPPLSSLALATNALAGGGPRGVGTARPLGSLALVANALAGGGPRGVGTARPLWSLALAIRDHTCHQGLLPRSPSHRILRFGSG